MRAWTRFPIVATALLATASLLPFGFAEENDAFRLEARLPSDAFGLVAVEALGTWPERFRKTAISALWNDPEMKGFTAPIEADLEQLISGEGGAIEKIPPMWRKLMKQIEGLEGQVAVGVIGMPEGAEMPTMAASLDFGAHVNDFVAFLEQLKAELGADGDALERTVKEGRTWWQLDTGGPVLSATTVDTTFVIATDPETLAGILQGREAGSSMAGSADFQAVRQKAGGDDLGCFVYANVPSILSRVADEMPRDFKKMGDALGLDTVKAAGYGMAFKGDGFMDSIVIHTPGADHGLAALDLLPPMRPQALKYVPSTAFYYAESSVPLGDLIPRIKKLVGDVDEDAVGDFDRGLSDLSQTLGVDVQNELMAGMGQGMALYAGLPETGGLYPELSVMLKVQDAAAFEGVFERFANGLAGWLTEEGHVIASTRDIGYHGQTLHLFEMQAAHGKSVIPFTPTWTVRDNWLMLTLVPYTMKEIVLRTSTTTGAGLAGQEDFASLLAQKPAAAGGVEYLDLQAILNLLYDTGAPLLQTAVKPNMTDELPVRLDWAQLPPARSIRKHFRSLAAFTSWNPDGITISIHAPVPVVAALAVVGGAAFFTYASVSHGRAMAETSGLAIGTSQHTMAQIQAEEILRYVRLYRLENKRLPASLDELVKAGIMRAIPRDPWGTPYELVQMKDPAAAYVRSAGPDKAFDTPDDVAARSK